ncbi:hypothetical protein [Microbulbifer magnicolonia]|nr:hypothetical protein [Microbulbifer sp. GG15]
MATSMQSGEFKGLPTRSMELEEGDEPRQAGRTRAALQSDGVGG